MFAVLGGLADVERNLMCTRTAEGTSRGKASGQHMARPLARTPQQQNEATRRRAEGLRSMNSPAAMPWHLPPLGGQHAPHEAANPQSARFARIPVSGYG
jgi:hypothetical protein